MGMEDKRLSDNYPCHSDMITYSLAAHKHTLTHFLKKPKKVIKICDHWGLYKYLMCTMCKRCGDRMDPFSMDFDKESIEMTDDDFTDMTPEYVSEVCIGSASACRYDGIPYPYGSTETSR